MIILTSILQKIILDKIDEVAKRKFQYGIRRRRTIKDTNIILSTTKTSTENDNDDFSCIKIDFRNYINDILVELLKNN